MIQGRTNVRSSRFGAGAMDGMPASYHNGAGGLAFVDGHSEIKKWQGTTVVPVKVRPFNNSLTMPVIMDDLKWLRYRTPRKSAEY